MYISYMDPMGRSNKEKKRASSNGQRDRVQRHERPENISKNVEQWTSIESNRYLCIYIPIGSMYRILTFI